MEYTPLGRSGLKVSRACLGTANFGTAWGFGIEEDHARPIIHAFLDAGHNFIDTADNYNHGESEEIVGRAVRGRRDAVVIATKVYQPQGEGPNDRGLSRVHLTQALDASLRRLDTDYVDLYQCHKWDPDTPIDETMETLDSFVRAGKVRYIGCSNFTASQIVESQWAAARVAGTPMISLQAQYSLLRRDIEAEIQPVCERHSVGMVAWSPLGGGILAGRYRSGCTPEPDTRFGHLMASGQPTVETWVNNQLTERNLRIAAEVGKVAADLGTSPAAVALAWVRDRPGVSAVVIGPRTVSQYEQSLEGFRLRLPKETLTCLEKVSGPPPVPVTGLTSLPWTGNPTGTSTGTSARISAG